MPEPFYLNGLLYDAMHAGVQSDISFYVDEAIATKGPVLELACGTGRITLPIARQGVDITGLDLMPSMLAQAEVKSGAEGLKVRWVQGDYRDYDLGQRFDLVFVAFNSLLHLHDVDSYERFFAAASRHLAPTGRLIIDVFNPNVAMLATGKERSKVLDFTDPETGEAAWIDESRVYDALSQVNRTTWTCASATRQDYLTHDLHLRCLFPQELRTMIQHAGFEVVQAYGNHRREPLTSASGQQILVLKKKD